MPGVAKAETSDLESYPIIKEGVGCEAYRVAVGDSWLTIAETNSVDYVELIRSNPSITADEPLPGSKIFIPPCTDGGEMTAGVL
jgi:hypothetical protein